MRSGYRIAWSDRAVLDLQHIISYLLQRWTEREVQKFVNKLDQRLTLISINPSLFPKTSRRKNVRRSVLTRQTVIYYELFENTVRIVTLFDPRQNPKKLKI